MLNEHAVQHVYLACGSTDLRKSIDGLAALVQGVPPAKREFTTLRRFQKKKSQFLSIKIEKLGFFINQEKHLFSLSAKLYICHQFNITNNFIPLTTSSNFFSFH